MNNSILESSFCKNCDNFMDITNNIYSISENKLGGADIPNVESSDYDVSMSESIKFTDNSNGGKHMITENNINTILDGSDTDIDKKKFDIDDLNKNQLFNKLSNDQKTLVINRILEKNPKQKLSKTNSHSAKESYYYCKSCGFHKKIPNHEFIFSRGNENKIEINNNFKNYIHDNILPKTKNYNCINSNCPTHKKPSIKMAVFYRHNGTYNVRYICKICNSFWDNYSDNKNI